MTSHRADLRNIARRAMIERGLWPDFSPAAMAELARIRTPATDLSPKVRDLTQMLWASIDNDDSCDLDQLTVATPRADRSVTIMVAIADVDALSCQGLCPGYIRSPQFDIGLHVRGHLPHATGEAFN